MLRRFLEERQSKILAIFASAHVSVFSYMKIAGKTRHKESKKNCK